MVFLGVYCRASESDKESLWKELTDCHVKWGNKGIIGGNFNMVLKREERSNSHFSVSCANEFQAFVNKFNIVDLPLKGGNWTWSKQKDNPSFSRIDQFLVFSDLILELPSLNQKVLSRPTSDHFPILLDYDGIQWGPCPFRIDNKWFKNGEFRDMIANVWNSINCRGTPSFIIATKLFRLKDEIKSWTKEVGKTEENGINDLMTDLDFLENMEGTIGLSNADRERRNGLKLELTDKLHLEAISWKQRLEKNR